MTDWLQPMPAKWEKRLDVALILAVALPVLAYAAITEKSNGLAKDEASTALTSQDSAELREFQRTCLQHGHVAAIRRAGPRAWHIECEAGK